MLAEGQRQWQGCQPSVILPLNPRAEVEKSMSQATVGAGLGGLSELKHSFGLEIIEQCLAKLPGFHELDSNRNATDSAANPKHSNTMSQPPPPT